MHALTVTFVLFYSTAMLGAGGVFLVNILTTLRRYRHGQLNSIQAHRVVIHALVWFMFIALTTVAILIVLLRFVPEQMVAWADVVYGWLLSWGTLM